jgi:hypothetical protein
MFQNKKNDTNMFNSTLCCPKCNFDIDLEIQTTIKIKDTSQNQYMNQNLQYNCDEIINKIKQLDMRENELVNKENQLKKREKELNEIEIKLNNRNIEFEKMHTKKELEPKDLKYYSGVKEWVKDNSQLKNDNYSINNVNASTMYTFQKDKITKSYQDKIINTCQNELEKYDTNLSNLVQTSNLLNNEQMNTYKTLINLKDWIGLEKQVKLTPPDTKVFEYVLLQSQDIEILKKLKTMKFPMDADTFVVGVKTGSIETINWLIDNNCPISKNDTSRIYKAAILYNDKEILKFLMSKSINLPDDIIEIVINGKKSIEFIEWLITKGAKFTPKCFESAISISNIEILNFLKCNGCEWGTISDYYINKIMDNYEIKNWLIENQCPWYF